MKSDSNSKIKQRRLVRQQGRRRSQIIIISSIVLAITVISYIIFSQLSAINAEIEGLKTFAVQGGHTNDPVTYPQVPPVGGIHNPVWQNCGVYSQPIENENGVHSLEHGAVWVTYHPDLAEDEIEKLETLTRRSGYRLLSPYPELPNPIVVSAWGYQLNLENADDSRIAQFIERYELSPNVPEPGASCSGGFGIPQ